MPGSLCKRFKSPGKKFVNPNWHLGGFLHTPRTANISPVSSCRWGVLDGQWQVALQLMKELRSASLHLDPLGVGEWSLELAHGGHSYPVIIDWPSGGHFGADQFSILDDSKQTEYSKCTQYILDLIEGSANSTKNRANKYRFSHICTGIPAV